MEREKPVEIEDERVGKHFEHARYGSTHYCEKAVMFNGHKFLTLRKVADGDGVKALEKEYNKIHNIKLPPVVSITSWCISDEWSDASFYMNYMEM